MRLARRKGQSTLEYLLIFAVIIIIVVAVIKAFFKPAVEQIYNAAPGKLNKAAYGVNLVQ